MTQVLPVELPAVRNDVDEAFAMAKAEGRAALIPYLTAGYPSPETFIDVAAFALDSGADALEIGVPFSDPLLDGPSIQYSQHLALQNGINLGDCLHFAEQVKKRSGKPLLLMGAFNPFLSLGLHDVCRRAQEAGVAGLIVPDIPLEEQGELRVALAERGLHLIQMVAPTSPPERISRIAEAASGFVYCVSVAGVTGARSQTPETATPLVRAVREATGVPVAVGFGIASPRQVAEVSQFADGVIVGSAMIDVLRDAPRGTEAATLGGFVSSLRAATGHA